MPDPSAPKPVPAPVPLVVLAACVGLEGAALVVLAVGELGYVLLHLGDQDARASVLFAVLAALFALYGGALLAAARAALRRRRWARALAVLSQLIGLLMGWQTTSWGIPAVGVPLLLVSATGLVLALAPQAGGLLVEPQADDGTSGGAASS
ncbi:hypothetical protein EV189_1897 [Motilibacter rhizosphaerae]|uniref:Uncharacterized protein n=1 Tax=Motilibacter rhizosphaerae TaxID=598652 RepID=A0A4Q7NT00_9ACTN|nr:hypothetical protein [Motilibacter rhizosphaerae]RZS90114.1 hypothetical protein EV189_1897 [Motilibacter rhizosphaerae]